MKTLILTPNKNDVCGMYQLPKDLAKELYGDIKFKDTPNDMATAKELSKYNKVITFLYPVHKIGRWMKKHQKAYWICYDQKVPEPNKQYFPNFFRRQYMKWFYWANQRSMKGADEYWKLSEREQKPYWQQEVSSLSTQP